MKSYDDWRRERENEALRPGPTSPDEARKFIDDQMKSRERAAERERFQRELDRVR